MTTLQETNEIFVPVFDYVKSQSGVEGTNGTYLFNDWWEFYDALFDSDGQVGVPAEISSWLLPREVILGDKPEELASKLLSISGGFGY